jgi:hypothetical protein
MAIANIVDQVLLWIHGRRLGLTSDGQTAETTAAIVVDGIVVASTRNDLTKTQLGNNGVGSLVLTGALVGDEVLNVTNLTAPGDVSSSFESTISVAGHIQQTAATNFSASQLIFSLAAKS